MKLHLNSTCAVAAFLNSFYSLNCNMKSKSEQLVKYSVMHSAATISFSNYTNVKGGIVHNVCRYVTVKNGYDERHYETQ